MGLLVLNVTAVPRYWGKGSASGGGIGLTAFRPAT